MPQDLHPVAAHVSGRLAAWQAAMKEASANLQLAAGRAVAPPATPQLSSNGTTTPEGSTEPLP